MRRSQALMAVAVVLPLAVPALAKDLATGLRGTWMLDKVAMLEADPPPFYKMATPEKKEGKHEKAHLRVHIAMNMLEQALGDFGAETKEGGAILKTLSSLAKSFGDHDAGDLVPAEMADIVSSMPQMGGGNPQMQALMKSMQQGQRGPAQFPPRPAPMPTPGM